MSDIKQAAINLIRVLPDDTTYAEILAELYFTQKVHDGLADVEAGRIISSEELRQRVAKWAKSTGH